MGGEPLLLAGAGGESLVVSRMAPRGAKKNPSSALRVQWVKAESGDDDDVAKSRAMTITTPAGRKRQAGRSGPSKCARSGSGGSTAG